MSEESEFEWVSSPSQFAPPPPLRKRRVQHPDIRHVNGKIARFYLCELSQHEWGEYTRSLRVQKPDGSWIIVDGQNERLVGRCARDANSNQLWPTDDAAVAFFGKYGKSVIDDLMVIVDEVHGPRSSAEGNAEKDFEVTPSVSSPVISPSTSENPSSTGS